MSIQSMKTDEEILLALQNGEESALEVIFRREYTYLSQSALRILRDTSLAEDMVQDVFVEVWKKRNTLNIQQSIRAYLRRAVVNRALNYIRDNKKKQTESDDGLESLANSDSPQLDLEGADVKKVIDQTMDSLPTKCREAFVLSRFEGLSYKEISEKMDVSVKTVEKHMSKALKIFRSALSGMTGMFWALVFIKILF